VIALRCVPDYPDLCIVQGALSRRLGLTDGKAYRVGVRLDAACSQAPCPQSAKRGPDTVGGDRPRLTLNALQEGGHVAPLNCFDALVVQRCCVPAEVALGFLIRARTLAGLCMTQVVFNDFENAGSAPP
jgi:hypothetical protein